MKNLKIYPNNKIAKFILKNLVYPIAFVVLIFYMLSMLVLLKTTKVGDVGDVSVYVSDNFSYNQDSILHYVEYGMSNLKQKNIDKNIKANIVFCQSDIEFKFRSIFVGANSLANTKPIIHTIVIGPMSTKNEVSSASSLNDQLTSAYVTVYIDSAIGHELTHIYQYSHFGLFVDYWKQITEPWKMEGYADYVANESVYNVNVGQKMFMEGRYSDEENWIEEAPFVNYFVGRLRTDYLLEYKKMPVEEYWNTKFDTEQLDEEIRSAFREGKYKLFKQNSHS